MICCTFCYKKIFFWTGRKQHVIAEKFTGGANLPKPKFEGRRIVDVNFFYAAITEYK